MFFELRGNSSRRPGIERRTRKPHHQRFIWAAEKKTRYEKKKKKFASWVLFLHQLLHPRMPVSPEGTSEKRCNVGAKIFHKETKDTVGGREVR